MTLQVCKQVVWLSEALDMLDVDDVWSMSASPCAIVVDEQGVLLCSSSRSFYRLLLLVLVLIRLTSSLAILFMTRFLTVPIDVFSLSDSIIIMLIIGSMLCFDGLVDRADDELS